MALRLRRPHLASMMETKLGELRGVLEAKKAALEKRFRVRDGIAGERSADPSDEAQISLDHELTVRALDHEFSMLSAVRLALERMDDGTYGTCQYCDGDISEKRLAAMPWATYCIKCQEIVDKAEKAEKLAA